jgi:membrane associated rhomboid family serine protease
MAAETDRRDSASERRAGFQLVGAMLVLMWVSEIVDAAMGGDLDEYGIKPREPDGLIGVVTSPFLHGGFDHLMSNTIPFVAMGLAIALNGVIRVLAVTGIVMLVGGVGTWLVAQDNSVHIGASGVVFGYGTYLIVRGFLNRSALELFMGLIVGAIWGTALLGGLLPRPGISWQGHLFGAIGGIVAARLLMRRRGDPPTRTPRSPAAV